MTGVDLVAVIVAALAVIAWRALGLYAAYVRHAHDCSAWSRETELSSLLATARSVIDSQRLDADRLGKVEADTARVAAIVSNQGWGKR